MRHIKHAKGILCLVLALLVLCTACGRGSSKADNQVDTYLIGVEVYNTSDPEILMFFNYLKNYIAESFPVEFIMSDSINTVEEELDFVDTMKEQGASGIISFFVADLEQVVAACEANEMYYVLGSSTSTDEEFNKVKDNPWFLGGIGPSNQTEYDAGVSMAETFLEEGAKDFLIVSGGAGDHLNYMHYSRVCGMLDTLVQELDLQLSSSVEDLAGLTELTVVDTGRDDVTLVISPGYVQMDPGRSNLEQALADRDYDAMMSTVSISSVLDLIEPDIKASDRPLLIGIVDCFSDENYEAIQITDNQGFPLLNFVHGKYASMVAPAFVAMFNAVTGYVDLVNPGGEAFRLYQSYWTATSEQEYDRLYGYTQSIYLNAYSSTDLMSVMGLYNLDATYEEFAALAQASDLDSVMERLSEV